MTHSILQVTFESKSVQEIFFQLYATSLEGVEILLDSEFELSQNFSYCFRKSQCLTLFIRETTIGFTVKKDGELIDESHFLDQPSSKQTKFKGSKIETGDCIPECTEGENLFEYILHPGISDSYYWLLEDQNGSIIRECQSCEIQLAPLVIQRMCLRKDKCWTFVIGDEFQNKLSDNHPDTTDYDINLEVIQLRPAQIFCSKLLR